MEGRPVHGALWIIQGLAGGKGHQHGAEQRLGNAHATQHEILPGRLYRPWGAIEGHQEYRGQRGPLQRHPQDADVAARQCQLHGKQKSLEQGIEQDCTTFSPPSLFLANWFQKIGTRKCRAQRDARCRQQEGFADGIQHEGWPCVRRTQYSQESGTAGEHSCPDVDACLVPALQGQQDGRSARDPHGKPQAHE
jgi:hypothetical protein